MPSPNEVKAALRTVKFPGIDRDIVTLGYVKSVAESGGSFQIRIELSSTASKEAASLESASRNVLDKMGIRYDLQFIAPDPTPAPASTPQAPPHSDASAMKAPDPLPHVRFKIAVSSGKGGVGKSTVAVNLAVALAQLGHKVGLLDSDIHGPSVPVMLGLEDEQPQFVESEGKLLPLERYGVKNVSIGYMVDRYTPVIWRGPMIHKAIQQLLNDVDWTGVEFLIFDLPPGTGDIQLSLAQNAEITGALIVTTPQDVALIDAGKGVQMFQKTDVPILGLIENMSFFCCPSCGHQTDIFGTGGGAREAKRLDLPLLGQIPIQAEVRAGGDEGEPIVVRDPKSDAAQAFIEIAKKLVVAVNDTSTAPAK